MLNQQAKREIEQATRLRKEQERMIKENTPVMRPPIVDPAYKALLEGS